MVTWNELTLLISRNPSRSVGLGPTFTARTSRDVEFIPLRCSGISAAAAAASAAASAPTPAIPTKVPDVLEVMDEEEDDVLLQPIPTALMAEESMRTKVVVVSAPPPVLQTKVVKVSTPLLPPLLPKSAAYSIDPVVLGIETADPLYLGAPARTRHAIEIEEAQRLEARLDALYKSEAGRSRGWTKVGIEAMIKPRCASGGDLKEIDRAKKPFLWSLLESDKGLMAFLDFVCVAKRIRVAVWDMAAKKITVYPAADASTSIAVALEGEDDGGAPPLYSVDAAGHPLSPTSDLLAHCDAHAGWTLLPPPSVLHSLSGLTLAELESVATKLGMDAAALPKGKANQVQALAAHKLRRRLLS